MADRDFMLVVALIAGFGLGWLVFDYLRRPAPATTSYSAQAQMPQYSYIPPQWAWPQQQYQQQPMPDRVQNDEDVEVFYNRDGSIKNLKVHRDVRSQP